MILSLRELNIMDLRAANRIDMGDETGEGIGLKTLRSCFSYVSVDGAKQDVLIAVW